MPNKNLALANDIKDRNAFFIERVKLLGQQSEENEGFADRAQVLSAMDFIVFIREGGTEEEFRQAHPETYKMMEGILFQEDELLERRAQQLRKRREAMRRKV